MEKDKESKLEENKDTKKRTKQEKRIKTGEEADQRDFTRNVHVDNNSDSSQLSYHHLTM